MTNRQQQIVLLLMALNALVFVVFFLLVAANYRLAADDFHYLTMVQEIGVWDTMVFHYQNWSPRWSSILAMNMFFSSAENRLVLLGHHFLTLAFGFISFWSFLSALTKKLQLPLNSWQTAITAIYLVATTFYISFAKSDSWFWMSATSSYVWGTFAAVLAASLIMQNWNSVARRILITILFLYVGGASESIALCSMVVLVYVGFRFHRKQPAFDTKGLHLATLACIIGFGISMMGPGIGIRREHLPHFPIQDRFLIGLWNYIKFNLKEIPLALPLAILFAAPFGFFGRKHLRYQLISIQHVFWQNRALWILADLMILLLALSLGLVMGEMGPERTWFPLTILVLTVCVAIGYQLGTWVYVKSNGRLFHLVIASLVLSLGYQNYVGFCQVKKTREYAIAVDERMAYISSLTETNSLIELKPLPESGWLFSAEISSDTAHFTNKHLGLIFANGNRYFVPDSLTSSP